MNERPENAEIGTEVFAAKILLRQFKNHMTAQQEISDKQ
jgi:hypothetical protein